MHAGGPEFLPRASRTAGSELALGLMSGTSCDGISLALTEAGPDGVRVLASRTVPYPAALRRRLLGAASLRAPELSALDFELGRRFGEAARDFLRRTRRRGRPLVVGSHGHTVVHAPRGKPPHTLQIGEAAWIARRTGLPVVSDFRPADLAAGGEGAPLIPAFDRFLFGRGPTRVLLNIGGIANLALAGRGAPALAFDTGPGNALMDLAASRASGGRRSFDRDGRIANRGEPDFAKLGRMIRDPYFRLRPPKSLDRARFGEDFLRRFWPRLGARELPGALATLSAFTALAVADQIDRFVRPKARPKSLVVSGGGALNPVLMRDLRDLLPELEVESIAAHGVEPLAKEPACFAWMALRLLRGEPNHLPAATGAKGPPALLGKVSYPPPRGSR